MQHIRPPAVAGLFYPDSPHDLAGQVRALLAAARPARSSERPKAIVVPHAGYVYSGPTAATVYSKLMPWRDVIKRVVLLGPSHRVPLKGLALPQANAFATPLGDVEIDASARASLARLPQVSVSDSAHAMEHSLEVQLPFLQTVLTRFTLVPLVVGRASSTEVAQVLDTLWDSDETLIVISSDLSHYLPYPVAQKEDRRTAQAILYLQPVLSHEQACGATPLNGLLEAAPAHGLQARMLDLCNSGDTAGDKQRVVGYGAFTFLPAKTAVS